MFAGIAGALVQGGYDAVIVNKPFDFPILHGRAIRRAEDAVSLRRDGFLLGDRLFNAVQYWVLSV